MAPHLRTTTRSTGLIVGLAGTASAAPLLFFLPGAEERLAMQAAKWGPRWNRGFAHFERGVQHGARSVEPGVKRGVQVVEPPLKRAALAIDRNIKANLKWASPRK
ncbi:uncharacterized protein LY89DRAFT_725551 [Mollisia scopiformis]|uniref:Uncharacterized protein n=1 Tax=Mollisia scopiformis TaxID=149040 RepID=A0A132B734_MOLSC|nr:uncharacterized protein LY89DRAFT_725551 [Mollisia scopiformis]KUJ07809.1 hypothetical protein LY89DRAFT_725551 [Mollisia scopiformis]